MGSSNSTNVSNYINNSTSIQSSVELNLKANSNVVVNSNATNEIKLSIGSTLNCCGALNEGIIQQSNESLAAYQIRVNARNVAYSVCVRGLADAKYECGFGVTQNAVSKLTISQDVTSEANAQLINDLMTRINSKVQEVIEQKNDSGILSDLFGESNTSNITNNIDNSIRADLSASLNQEAQAQARSSSGQTNTAAINLCSGSYSGDKCTVSQDSSIDVYITQVIGLAAKIVSDNKMAQNVSTVSKANVSQTNTNWLSDFINALTMMEKVIIIAIIAIVIGAVIFAVVIVLRSMGASGKHNGADYSVGRNQY